jgi:hypothetical protein
VPRCFLASRWTSRCFSSIMNYSCGHLPTTWPGAVHLKASFQIGGTSSLPKLESPLSRHDFALIICCYRTLCVDGLPPPTSGTVYLWIKPMPMSRNASMIFVTNFCVPVCNVYPFRDILCLSICVGGLSARISDNDPGGNLMDQDQDPAGSLTRPSQYLRERCPLCFGGHQVHNPTFV